MVAAWNDPSAAWDSTSVWWNGGSAVPPFTPRLPLKAIVVEAVAVAVFASSAVDVAADDSVVSIVVADGAVEVAVDDTSATASLVGLGPATVVVAP